MNKCVQGKRTEMAANQILKDMPCFQGQLIAQQRWENMKKTEFNDVAPKNLQLELACLLMSHDLENTLVCFACSFFGPSLSENALFNPI